MGVSQRAHLAELVDALVLGTSDFGCAGSSPAVGTSLHPRSPAQPMGFLYIIGNRGQTKIGITANIQRRMNELKPEKIYKVVASPRYKQLEKELHRLFAHKRLHGSEYFSLNWFERRRACRVARRAGKNVRFPHGTPWGQGEHLMNCGVALGICFLVMAVGLTVF